MIKGDLRAFAMLCGCAVLLAGCPQEGGDYRPLGAKDDVTNVSPPDHHHHHDHGPHGGHIVELGDYHGEVTMDESRVITLYILGEDAQTAVPVADATAVLHVHGDDDHKDIPMTAAPQDGETDGKTSRFTVAAADVPESVKDIEDLHGAIKLTVAGKEFSGEITHDHDHGHGHGHKH